ncbi:uncharacterized protein LOC122293343 isoform X3 [Carya illinoinensis]|uniref:PGG domain-containing protein n=1 Tax=Carya illinoinensis TaxID=32201 RepID=A0A8T1NAI2_CARIL|nr:uncharacterized protein LOC122293343 isoform X3 [Carya illinoinensis]KAG6619508.1 hypothetical protein I3842_Q094400 [Carya illinoinensis]KAG6619509.1 hypothetical protein I3842_Q094400 [Carya illinoinensis]KAG6628699.1 hypothetical protein CIPAW_14G031400 [Carya illinoinensis]
MYADLYKAVLRGKLKAAKEFLDSQPEAVRKAITHKGETALHIAVTAGHAHIVKELVDQHHQDDQDGDGCRARMTKEDLGIEDGDGCTALMKALEYGRSELARYLYTRTPLKDLMPAEKDKKGAMLLTRAIYSKNLELALDLIWRFPHLTYALDDHGESPFLALASMPHAFPRENQLVFWKQWIYDHCIRIDQSASSTYEIRLNINSHLGTTQSVPAKSIVSNLLGIEQLYDMKKIHSQSKELLSSMCEVIPTISQTLQLTSGGVYDAINRAVKNGIFEFVSETLSKDPRFLEKEDTNLRNILMLAVLYRHSKIFSHIHGLDKNKALTFYKDRNDDNVLHMAAIVEDSTRLDRSSGAALQMQRELQWFKEVEEIVSLNIKEGTNKDNLTPRQLFTKNHEDMMEKGEKWMKDTASSCTVVGALIVTIMFTVAFTVPGGYNQNYGFPIFLKKKLFMLFIITDALSLFSSSTSVLMFLGILTSRYAEKDFLKSLPKKMIIGLSALFLSIATMMIAFSAALLIMLSDQLQIAIPLICLTGVPAFIFVWIQFPILKDMFMSTLFPRILNRKMKP